jgi:hypothetical protein
MVLWLHNLGFRCRVVLWLHNLGFRCRNTVPDLHAAPGWTLHTGNAIRAIAASGFLLAREIYRVVVVQQQGAASALCAWRRHDLVLVQPAICML